MDNLPILYKNIMDGLPSDFAREVFLWAVDKFPMDFNAYEAESFTREASHLACTCKNLIDMRQRVSLRDGGILLTEDQGADLLRYMQARHANWRLGGNVKSAMPELTA